VADEKEPAQSPGMKSDVWDYVRRRNELDKEIQEKFNRPVTIMFTDIKGSTTFFDMRGDLEGVTMLQRHNELVVPPIEAHGGRVLQRLGDGLLATFPTATPGVKAGIEIQKRLHEYNSRAPERERIHVRVGLNSGMGLVEESNVFGDAVNTAARVQTLAEPDQILVSESTYKEASKDLGTDIFLPVGPAALKGKLEKVVVLEVIWSPEQARLRAAVQPDGARGVLHLEISRTGARLKVVSHEVAGGEEAALREVEEAAYDEAQVGQAVDRVEAIMSGADREGRISKQNLEDLGGLGHQLWELLLTPHARARLSGTTAPELVLTIDDQLARIPWELLNDGREFLCLRFAMGRVVSTAKQLAASRPRDTKGALKVAVVADPQGTLPEALREGTQLGTLLGDRPEYQVVVNDRGVSRAEFLAQFGTSDVVHVAGQVEYDAGNAAGGGFALRDGRVSATELGRLPSGATVPRLVLFTACEAPTAGQNRHTQAAVFGLAAAILTAGVKHFVGSLRAIAGSAGFQFASDVYRLLSGGQSIGLAVRDARREAARRHGKTELTWAAYVLYGDPTSRYVSGRVDSAPVAGKPAVLERKRLMALLTGAAAVVVVAGGLYYTMAGGGGKAKVEAGYKHLQSGQLADAGREFQAAVSGRPAEAYEGLALVALKQGDPAAAQKFCGEVQRIGASRPGCVLLQGDAAAIQGDFPKAAANYEQVVSFAGVPDISKSIAYTRLGRLSAEQGQTDKAAAAYGDAQKTDPGNWEALSNMGALLRRQGKYAEAATALDKAAAINPNDAMVQALLKDVRDADGSAKDAEKQKRVDALVDELAARFKRGDVVKPPAGRDDWTSPPLTISLLGLESRGRVAFREGEYEFMLLRIGQALEGQTRARLVERNVMDKLLAELKLSSSALADQKTALQLGRVLSARLITVGTVAGGANEWTLTLRVIETETSTVVASVAQGFPVAQSTAQVADVVAKDLAARLRKTFPLRARVTGGGKGEAVLNVGSGEGAAVGQKLLIFREGAGGQRDVVGEAEITEVTDKTSRAKLADETRPITPGLKALERI
jgi:class 3 adenylate cyclase/CHAT domain-containing protein/tetratricopeptide (TPR) repeat protein